jgi:hypothetical protein
MKRNNFGKDNSFAVAKALSPLWSLQWEYPIGATN